VKRGRESLENLTEEERLIFEFMHIRILNTIELWYVQLEEASPSGEYYEQQLENIEGVIVFMLNYPGAQEIWAMMKHTFVPVQKLIDDTLASAEPN
jgi:hypothetical protein